MTDFVIEKATISQAKAKIAIVGPAGSGKTYTALTTARELGKQILVIDTENKSSTKYADRFDFDVLNLTEYKLTSYIAALEYSRSQGYDVVIVDSLSHAWVGPGGALEQVDQAAGNKFTSGWKIVTPLHNKLVATILSFPIHLIATMRMKMDYILVLNEHGKQVPQKVGLGIVQRDGLEYEFDIVGEMSIDHHLTITKTRCFDLDGFEADKPDGLLGQQIRAWLTEGGEQLLFPNGWYPTKEQFFAKARNEFGWSNDDIAQRLIKTGFTSGFVAANAAKMWNVIQAKVSDNQEGQPTWYEFYNQIIPDIPSLLKGCSTNTERANVIRHLYKDKYQEGWDPGLATECQAYLVQLNEEAAAVEDKSVELAPKDAFLWLSKLAIEAATEDQSASVHEAIEHLDPTDGTDDDSPLWRQAFGLLLGDLKEMGLNIETPKMLSEGVE